MMRRSIRRAARTRQREHDCTTTSRRCQSSIPAGFYARTRVPQPRPRPLWCNGRDELAHQNARVGAPRRLARRARLRQPPLGGEAARRRAVPLRDGGRRDLDLPDPALHPALDRTRACRSATSSPCAGRPPGAGPSGWRSAPTSRSSSAPACSWSALDAGGEQGLTPDDWELGPPRRLRGQLRRDRARRADRRGAHLPRRRDDPLCSAGSGRGGDRDRASASGSGTGSCSRCRPSSSSASSPRSSACARTASIRRCSSTARSTRPA